MEKGKKLYRSRSNRYIAGVCGGIGEYFGIDATIVRLLFLFTLMIGGSAILVYITTLNYETAPRCHSRESGNPEFGFINHDLDSRFRGNDTRKRIS